jgi:hypothetical protein
MKRIGPPPANDRTRADPPIDTLIERLGVMASDALSHAGRPIRSRADATTLIATIRTLQRLRPTVSPGRPWELEDE